MEILAYQLTSSEKYLVAGQKLTSYTLNKHASLYFSSKTNFVVRGLQVTYNSSLRTFTVKEGACVVRNILISIPSDITLNTATTLTPLYIVVDYPTSGLDKICDIPYIKIITADSYNSSTMTILATATYNTVLRTYDISYDNTIKADVAIDTIPINNVITVALCIQVSSFRLHMLPSSNFNILSVYLDGTYMKEGEDYTYNSSTKTLTFQNMHDGYIHNVTLDLKINDYLFPKQTYILSSVYPLTLTSSEATSVVKIGKTFETHSTVIFKNGLYLHNYNNSDYTYDSTNKKITFATQLQPTDILRISSFATINNYSYISNPSLYAYFPAHKYTLQTIKPSSTMSSYLISGIYKDIIIFKNGLLLQPNTDYILQTSSITFTPALAAGDVCTIITVDTSDITNISRSTLTANQTIISYPTNPTYGILMVFVNRTLLREIDYTVNLTTKQITLKNSFDVDVPVCIITR
jgi:hypothetical protein